MTIKADPIPVPAPASMDRLIAEWRERAERNRRAAVTADAEGFLQRARAYREVAAERQICADELVAELDRLRSLMETATQQCEECRMGHVRLDECAAKAPPGTLHDRISWHIERLATDIGEKRNIIEALGHEKDELRAKASAAEGRRLAAEYRAMKIQIDSELQQEITSLKRQLRAASPSSGVGTALCEAVILAEAVGASEDLRCGLPKGHDGKHEIRVSSGVGTAPPEPQTANVNDGGSGEAAYCHHRHHLAEHSTDFDTCPHSICVNARQLVAAGRARSRASHPPEEK